MGEKRSGRGKKSSRHLKLSSNSRLVGKKIVVAFSGGPDAAALAARLLKLGASIIPVYLTYRNKGGKTVKDLKGALDSAKLLGLPTQYLENPLERPISGDEKSRRNRIILETFAQADFAQKVDAIGLGTFEERFEASGLWTDESNEDLAPSCLLPSLSGSGLDLITWDSFGIFDKTSEFKGLPAAVRRALYATTSCQMWWKVECGNCYSCRERHEAFLAAFGEDPTIYRPNSTIGKSL